MPRLLAAVVICCAALAARAATPAAKRAAAAQPKVASLDASKLPADQARRYRLVEERCASCHSLERVLATDFTSPQWKNYLKRALKRPEARLTAGDAQEIYDFLKWRAGDGSKR